jgi:hypothetical protein
VYHRRIVVSFNLIGVAVNRSGEHPETLLTHDAELMKFGFTEGHSWLPEVAADLTLAGTVSVFCNNFNRGSRR